MEKKREELVGLLQSVDHLTHELRDELAADAAYRKMITNSCQSILQRTQAPPERAWELFIYPSVVAASMTALEAGWLDQVANANGTGVTAHELVKKHGSDAALASRIMRLLATVGIVDESGVKSYAPNKLTVLLSATAMRYGVSIFSNNLLTFSRMPEHFKNTNYQTPPDVASGPFALAEGMSFWEMLATQPERREAFAKYMDGHKMWNFEWYETYPLEELQVQNDKDLLFVDVAGGLGHEIIKFNNHRKKLKLPGRLVLQDQANVLAQVPEDWKKLVSAVAIDFFKPQPEACRHARVYHMRHIIHDWDDASCLTILGHLRDAMKAGYSTLFICDLVLPDRGCSFCEASFDVMIMAMMSGKERTWQEWDDLIGQVDGLKIDKILPIKSGTSYESLIQISKIE